MFWYTENLSTCGQIESRKIKASKDDSIEIVEVWDLIDTRQDNWGQFQSKVNMVEKALKKGKKVVVACRGGMSRSNAVVLAYLIKSGMKWDDAYNIIRKNPDSRIRPELLAQIKERFTHL